MNNTDAVRDPFASLMGEGRGYASQTDSARADSGQDGYQEPTVELLAAKGAAVVAHFAPAYLSRELAANDPDFNIAASDIITNILHAVAQRDGADAAAQMLGKSLADMLFERAELATGADGAELDPFEVEHYAEAAYGAALSRAGA